MHYSAFKFIELPDYLAIFALMENFIVSARKYRPATFDTVVGQQHITNTLKNAIKNNHLAQAFLFCGPRGVGKTTCARILAKTINCFNITSATEACNECESCKSFNSGASLNVYELDAASNNSVEDIRNLIDQVRLAPQLGNRKIYIIDEVHMLSQAAFNAFLKTLEEPPKHAIFILATTEKHKIIPTILSRCQIFDFNRIQIEDMAKHLAYVAQKENIQAEPDALHVIAQKADGALRDALSIFDQIVSFAGNNITYKAVIENLNVLDYDYYFKLTDYFIQENIPQALLLFNEILNHGFDGHHFIVGCASHFRNLMVCKDAATIQLLEVGNNIKEKYKEQASKASMPLLLKGLNILSRADVQYKSSKNPRLLVELSLMQLCSINSDLGAEKKNDYIKPPMGQADLLTAPAGVPLSVTAEVQKTATPVSNQIITNNPVSTNAKPVSQNTKPNPTTAIPSISQMLNKGATAVGKTESITPAAAAQPKTISENFTQDQLIKAWDLVVQHFHKQGKVNVASALNGGNPALKENFTIEIATPNKVIQEVIYNEQKEAISFLSKILKNDRIQFNVIINAAIVENKPYTNTDKFKRMSEKNPALNKLKSAFDLEVGV